MSGQHDHSTYRILIRGSLGRQWIGWFDDITITQTDEGNTALTGTVPDQAALQGILAKIGILNLTLISVTQIDPASDEKPADLPEEDFLPP